MAGSAARLLLAALLGALPAAAERELRFRPPAEAPVRLFTEPELARYDGQQVGAGGRQSRGGASGPRASPAGSFQPRGRAGPGLVHQGRYTRAGGASWHRTAQPPPLASSPAARCPETTLKFGFLVLCCCAVPSLPVITG